MTVVNKETGVKKVGAHKNMALRLYAVADHPFYVRVWQSIAETAIERDLPFVDPRPRHEVGTVAMPLLRLCILQLELSLMVLDTSGAHPLSPEAAKKLDVSLEPLTAQNPSCMHVSHSGHAPINVKMSR